MSALVRIVGKQFFVRAFDDTRDSRPWHRLCVGDRIEWKKQGFTGFERARVERIGRDGKVLISPVDRDGAVIAGLRARNIMARAIMVIHDPETRERRRPALPSELEPV